MDSRAGPLLANRSLSALIVVSFVMSAFAGMYVLTNPSPSTGQPIGDLIITSGTYTIENIEQPVDGNVEVSDTGELIIRNGALKVISNVGTPRTVIISNGGKLTLEHGVLTTYLDQIQPYPFLTVTIDDATVKATEGSSLRFPGYLNIQNGGELTLNDSSIERLLPEDMIYVQPADEDRADDGPRITLNDGSLMMFDSSIPDLPEYGATTGLTAGNLTLEGESTLLAVNSYISVDFGPLTWYNHNMLVLNDTSSAHLYGSYFDPVTPSPPYRVQAIVASGESTIALPDSQGPEDTTGDTYTDLLASGEGLTLHVQPGEVMAIDSFTAGPSATVDGAVLYIRYRVDPGYGGTNSFTWQREGVGSPASTGITPLPTETLFVEHSFDLHGAGVVTTDDLGALDINFRNNGGTGDLQVDSMSIVITIGPEAYIYRWISVAVGDEYGVPIPDSDVSAIFTGSSTFEGQPAFYFGGDGAGALPPSEVLDYMDVDADEFGVTGPLGLTTIPLLTDIVCGSEDPNSLFVGNFKINGTTIQGSTPYSSVETFSFPAYPAMSEDDQAFDLTVEVVGISAESPDLSRWLVVPPDLTIENMTYYHAGDVIVAADGNLIFRNSVLQLVQEEPNQRTIYVDGTANFKIEDSAVVSGLPIDIIVKGEGTLEVYGSSLTGVSIVAMEDAVVIIDDSTMNGYITTSWNSRAHITVRDSTLTQSPVLSGMSVGAFTSVSIPSIEVEDDAKAMIYRWIYVTVFDGAENPLQRAVVSARFLANDTHFSTTITNVTGVARINSLGTILTAEGPSHVGNYKINATYWSLGVPYESDNTISVGVMQYTEPLTANATYVLLRISDLFLADIDVIALWTVPEDVVNNTVCTVSVSMSNIGDIAAEDIPVDFYVGTDPLDSVVVPILQVDESVVVPVEWTPDTLGLQTLRVVVNDESAPVFDEGSFANNEESLEVLVLDYADLSIGAITFYLGDSPETSAPGGETITIRATLYNSGEAPVTNPLVELTVDYGDGFSTVQLETVYGVLPGDGSLPIVIDYLLREVVSDADATVTLEANPTRVVPETSYDNNIRTAPLLVLDVREDLKVATDDIYVLYGVDNETVPEFGREVTIFAEIFNLGGTDPGPFTIQFGIRQGTSMNRTIAIVDTEAGIFPGGQTVQYTNYRINLTIGGIYELYVFVDPYGNHSEKNESNNFAVFSFEIVALDVDISVTPDPTSAAAGDLIIVTVLIKYAGTEMPVVSLEGVTVDLRDSDGDVVPGTEAVPSTTSANGAATFSITIPSALEGGRYSIVASVANVVETAEYEIDISGEVSERGIPMLVLLIVIAAIIAVVVGFTVYTYVYGLGKLVECGECGAFVPAASRRCKKCGVEFEVGTMKCSECGAWVPAESAECPNCGVKFVGEELGDEDYLDKMRVEYEEMVSKYRELAQPELGKRFSEKQFEQWWRTQPTYISFDDWLAKEEERRKEGPVACPVCGTMNPKEATVCHKCGTVFGAPIAAAPPPRRPPAAGIEAEEPEGAYEEPSPEAGPPAQQPPAAPKMVIRRPIDRKVVPKKIIKTPIKPGEDSGEGDESQ